MFDRARIRGLIPHAGAMCLLDEVLSWSAETITCRTAAHLSPGNPLRRDDRLAAICGAEFGLQAAALHGALRAGGEPQPAGYVAALRSIVLTTERLDDPALGALTVTALLDRADTAGTIYRFALLAESGAQVLSGAATIILPRPKE
ncbi:MAG: phosphotransferase [Acetobacteraceae bacterium]|nr:phosphotransferase [Acetobacteraceae bacterium]